MKSVDIDLAVFLLEKVPKLLGLGDEPMFVLNDRAISYLEHLLGIPDLEYGGVRLYETISEQSAALFYFTIKDHKFENGNKRTAIVLTLAFLHQNSKWIEATPKQLYDIALAVAKSRPSEKDLMLKSLSNLFDEIIVDR